MLVLAPMGMEAAALRAGARGIEVRRTGVGPVRSRRGLGRIDLSGASEVVVAGLCGSLQERCAPGDLVVPRELQSPDGRVRPVAGPDWRGALRRAGFVVHEGPIRGVERPVTGPDRRALAEGGAVAVDMESPWLADALAGRPLSVLRVVLDSPDHELFHVGTLVRLARCLRSLSRLAAVLSRGPARSPTSSRS